MHVDLRHQGEVVIVDISGRIVAGVGDSLLREVIQEVLNQGWTQILLNLSEVKVIDSSGVGELVAGLKAAQKVEARMKIVQEGSGGGVRKILQLSHILPLFEVYDNEREALETF